MAELRIVNADGRAESRVVSCQGGPVTVVVERCPGREDFLKLTTTVRAWTFGSTPT